MPCYNATGPSRMTPMTLVSIPANPVPEGAVAGMIKTPDGVELRFARFSPPAGRKGTLCLFHGRAEFIEKYFEVVQDARSTRCATSARGISRTLPNTRSISTPS